MGPKSFGYQNKRIQNFNAQSEGCKVRLGRTRLVYPPERGQFNAIGRALAQNKIRGESLHDLQGYHQLLTERLFCFLQFSNPLIFRLKIVLNTLNIWKICHYVIYKYLEEPWGHWSISIWRIENLEYNISQYIWEVGFDEKTCIIKTVWRNGKLLFYFFGCGD